MQKSPLHISVTRIADYGPVEDRKLCITFSDMDNDALDVYIHSEADRAKVFEAIEKLSAYLDDNCDYFDKKLDSDTWKTDRLCDD